MITRTAPTARTAAAKPDRDGCSLSMDPGIPLLLLFRCRHTNVLLCHTATAMEGDGPPKSASTREASRKAGNVHGFPSRSKYRTMLANT